MAVEDLEDLAAEAHGVVLEASEGALVVLENLIWISVPKLPFRLT